MSELIDYLSTEIKDDVESFIEVMSESICVEQFQISLVFDELFRLGLLDVDAMKEFINFLKQDCDCDHD